MAVRPRANGFVYSADVDADGGRKLCVFGRLCVDV